MVRSKWIILAVGLTWASGVSGQEPRLQPVPQTASGERSMTVQEMGKPPRKCRVLQEWRQANGSLAYKVQALDTGEFMTIAENSSVVPTESLTVPVTGSTTPMVLKTMATKIYHWGSGTSSPPGAPLPPETAEAASSCGCNGGGGQICDCQDSVPATGARPLFPRLRQALAGNGGYPVFTEEQMTTVPGPTLETADQGPPSPGLGSRVREGLQSVFKGRTSGDNPTTAQAKPVPESAAPSPPTPNTPLTEKAVVDPNDWRKSWGQPSDFKSQTTAKRSDDKNTAKNSDSGGIELPPNSLTETEHRPDPLVNPERLAQRAEEKLAAPKPSDFHPFDKPPSLPTTASVSTSDPAWSAAPSVPQTFNGKMPMGAQSVLAAGSGPNTQIQYLPVPVVTVPSTRPPAPPTTGLPAPPPPPAYVNAFTPMAMPQAPLPMAQQQAMAYSQGQYLPAGYMPSPYVPGQGNVPNPYYATGQGMGSVYPSPYPPPAIPQQRPPVSYQGPTAPNPFAGAAVIPAAYTTPATPTVTLNAAMDRRVVTPAVAQPTIQDTLKQLTTTLRESIFPSQRELAAEGLMSYDWHEHPETVLALLTAARSDAAPLVRATCVHCLARMNVHNEQVVTTLGTLRNDADAGVRQEVEQALALLGGPAR